MLRYSIKRIVSLIPLLFVISFLDFMFVHLIPGDPARQITGPDATKAEVDVVREQLGLNKPLLTQYKDYMTGLIKGDLGMSVKNNKSVADTIAPRLKPTVMLTISSMIWATIMGIGIGIISAIKHGKSLDYIGMIIAISGISIPGFWLGLQLIQSFSEIGRASCRERV